MSVRILGHLSPVFMVGESHCLVFGDVRFQPLWSDQEFHCRTAFLPTLRAAHYFPGDVLHTDLTDGLRSAEILNRYLHPAFLRSLPAAAQLAGAPLIAPPIVLFAGDMDLHGMFAQFAAELDFELPDDPGYGIDAGRDPVPWAAVRLRLTDTFTPFLAAVRHLRSVGFSRLMIHCLPPRTADDMRAASFTSGVVVPASVRAKLTVAANRLLAAFCAQERIGFVDTWPELAENGYLRPEFDLDGVHLNRESVPVSLGHIAARLFDHTRGTANPSRYEQAVADAGPYRGADPHGTQWTEHGAVAGRQNPDVADDLDRTFALQPDAPNRHARPDWAGWPRPGRPGAAVAEPDEQTLDRAVKIFAQDEARALLHAGADCELTIVGFRQIRVAPPIEPVDDVPPGVRRAVLFLAPFSPYEKGSLVVYDPSRFRFDGSAGDGELDLIEFTLVPRLAGQPFRVVWSGLCDWPADPFQFSVRGMTAAPAFDDDVVTVRASGA
jgi:hypothetical protein